MPCPVRRWLAVSGSRLARGQGIRAWTLLHAPPQNRKILLASVSYSTDHFQREARMPPLLCPDTRGSFNIKKWVNARPPGYSHHTRLLLVAIRHYISQAQHPGNGDLGDGSVLGTPDSMFQWVGSFIPLYLFPVALDVSRYGGPFEAMSFDIDTRDHSSFTAVAHCRMCLPVSVR
jgi:hypothetical protein